MTDDEVCPVCSAELERSLAHGLPAGDTGNGVGQFHREERDCPSCGSRLTRRVGGPWRPVAE